MISFPAPALCQGADEDLLLGIGAAVFPGCIKRWPGENGLRVWVDGGPTDPAARADALAKFQIALGVLRAWSSRAGELKYERLVGLGEGSVRDESGNQWIMAGPVNVYQGKGRQIDELAHCARRGIDASENLQNALWLNGRSNRTAADFYMVHEYAELEFLGTNGISDSLNLSIKSQSRLTAAANTLSPLLGGRHAKASTLAPMTLDEQCEYVAELLRRWIRLYE